MVEIMSIITLAAAVLQIVLFFKIWKMTDDVAAIKELCKPQSRVHTELIAADPEELKKTVSEAFMAQVEATVKDHDHMPDYKKRQVEVLAQKYNEIARKIGADIDFTQCSKGLYERTQALLDLE